MTDDDLKKWSKWVDYNGNPLIKPRPPDWIIADPTFIPSNDSPDGYWHLFAHSIISGINHFISKDGIKWVNSFNRLFHGIRPFLYKENEIFYLLYEKLLTPFSNSVIIIRESEDLFNWSPPKVILRPSLPWEGKRSATNGNPCLIKYKKQYRLYYSAGSVFLKDCLFSEPKYIGIASANNIFGPYKKRLIPIIKPNKNFLYRNLGAGAIKVIYLENEDIWLGFNNGIYIDKFSKTRSSILLLKSNDGINFINQFKTPIVSPTSGWKRSFVYQLDIRKINDSYWMYYNARNGWFFGVEKIGLSKLQNVIK
ncbi:MAG: glycosyl hydrolase family 43 [Candidatus Helarchaeota archaeon]